METTRKEIEDVCFICDAESLGSGIDYSYLLQYLKEKGENPDRVLTLLFTNTGRNGLNFCGYMGTADGARVFYITQSNRSTPEADFKITDLEEHSLNELIDLALQKRFEEMTKKTNNF